MRSFVPPALLGALALVAAVAPARAEPDRLEPVDLPGTPAKPAAKPARKPATAQDLVVPDKRLDVDELLLRGASAVPVSVLVDEIIDDVVHDFAKLDPAVVSPIAFRAVQVSPNLRSTFAHELESKLIAAIASSTDLKQVSCAECRAMKSRVENGDWVVTLGPVSQADVRRLGENLGAKSFFEVDFNYWSGTNAIEMQGRLVRASDGFILWSESFRSDGTTAALLRGSERVQSRAERREELDRLIKARPYYGYALHLGTSMLQWDNPEATTRWGALVGVRFFEKFGPEQRSMFGIQGQTFLNFSSTVGLLMGGYIGGVYLYELSEKSLHLPELRVGGGVGGFVVGTEGNSFYAEAIAEAILKFRYGVGLSLFYMYPTQYLSYDLGGLGFKVVATFNW